MKENNKNKLLASVCVFSFVAFCFAIAQTFGNTYAVSTDCPSGWDNELIGGEPTSRCSKLFSNVTTCENEVSNLGLTPVNSASFSEGQGTCYDTVTEDGIQGYVYRGAYYIVTYNLNGGTMSQSSSIEKVSGASVTLPKPSKTGHTFKHWIYTNSSGTSSVTVNSGEELTISSNMTLTAVWEEITPSCWKCEATNIFEWNSGRPEASCASTWIEDTTKTESTCKNTIEDPKEPTTPISKTFKATFDANKGTISEDTSKTCTTIAGEDSCKISDLPTATRDGFIFEGWGTTASCTSGSKELTLTENSTYYACWSEEVEEKYNVTFNLDGGNLYRNGSQTIKFSYALSSLDYLDYIAKKDGHTFIGWSTSPTSCNNASKDRIITKLNNDLKLYACYEENENEVVTPENPEINENPNTGSGLLYIAYLTGILALCYTGYYSYRYVKSKIK